MSWTPRLPFPIFEELRGLVRKTFGLTYVLQEALLPIADRIDLAFVFGSVANGTENSSSDVDLMVISNSVSLLDLIPGIRSAEHRLMREVNASCIRGMNSVAELLRVTTSWRTYSEDINSS
jgi:predicted nucleotidyltransferase